MASIRTINVLGIQKEASVETNDPSPDVVYQLWGRFSNATVDLFSLVATTHCPVRRYLWSQMDDKIWNPSPAIKYIKCVSELHSFSVSPTLTFWTNGYFIPKVLSSLHLNQDIQLVAFHALPFNSEEDEVASSVPCVGSLELHRCDD